MSEVNKDWKWIAKENFATCERLEAEIECLRAKIREQANEIARLEAIIEVMKDRR